VSLASNAKSERWRRPKVADIAKTVCPLPFAPLPRYAMVSCLSSVLLEWVCANPNQPNLTVGEQTPLPPRINESSALRPLRHIALCDLDNGCALCRVQAVNLADPTPPRTARLESVSRNDNPVLPLVAFFGAPSQRVKVMGYAAARDRAVINPNASSVYFAHSGPQPLPSDLALYF